jgi:hypothetical protein
MAVKLKSTKAKVRNPENVLAILDAYAYEGIEFNLQGGGSGWTLEMTYFDPDLCSWKWPRALRWEELPSEHQYPDKDDFDQAKRDLYYEKGSEGFRAMLLELAAHLESPILILVTMASPEEVLDWEAEVWRVEPGAKEVELLKI